MVLLTGSPGPSLEVPDELLLLSPLHHPEFVGYDVAGMDPALGTGPIQVVRGGKQSRTQTSLRGSLPPCLRAPPETDLMTSSGKFCWLFLHVRRQPRQWAWLQLGRMPNIRSASGLSHTLSMQMPHTISRLSCSLCSHTQGQSTSIFSPPPPAGHTAAPNTAPGTMDPSSSRAGWLRGPVRHPLPLALPRYRLYLLVQALKWAHELPHWI